jgi:hypothetical protein
MKTNSDVSTIARWWIRCRYYAMIDGTDIAMASRELKTEEK